MNKEISILTLWKVLKNSWKVIVIITLIVMLIAGLYTNYGIKKKYSSSVTFYVINTSSNSEYTTSALLQAIEQLSNDYIELILSDVIIEPLVEDLNEEHGWDYTPGQIRNMISASIISDTSMFKIRVTNTDKEHAYIIAQYINDNAPEKVKDVVKPWLSDVDTDKKDSVVECITAINHPQLATSYDSPNLSKNVLIAGIASALLVYVIFLLKSFFNTVVKTEDDIKPITDKYPLIGRIPTWRKK
ncbi:MAG: hypothetical protein J6A83_02260 [Clostridia bacterium]|nr:hypothetical protein [Clostridia bacterium]